MDLREQLARRLWHLQTLDDSRNRDDWDTLQWRVPGDAHDFRRIADECIRQMDWARRRCAGPRKDSYYDPERPSAVFHMPGTYVDLTLAPDDWKP